jgi:ribosomal protein S18 acetylase RimI-like enzyme
MDTDSGIAPVQGTGGPAERPPVTVRRAEVRDAAALVRLRALMFASMGEEPGPEDAPWRADAQRWFAERLARPAEFAAFVVDDAELGVVSTAVGMCYDRAPGPLNPAPVTGHLSNVSTDPRRQRRGYAKACLEALLDWFGRETDAWVVNLHATSHGDALYRSLGFDSPRHPELHIRLSHGERA